MIEGDPGHRLAVTVPLPGPLHAHRDQLASLADQGYSGVWSGETNGADAFTPLVLAAAWEPRLSLGAAIVSAFTRAPACLAQSAASLADAAPGRAVVGIGASSNVIVERWNGLAFEEPYRRVRDMVRFLREALEGGKVDREFDTFAVRGFRLGLRPEVPPAIHIGALREGMLRLAGREADGAIVNWLSSDDAGRVSAIVRDEAAARGRDGDVVARVFVCVTDDDDLARHQARRMIAEYLNVPVYAEFHRWLGRGPLLEAMWAEWQAGDRARALAAIPDEVVDDLIIHGSASHCRRAIDRYFEHGVSTVIVTPLLWDPDVGAGEMLGVLAPSTLQVTQRPVELGVSRP